MHNAPKLCQWLVVDIVKLQCLPDVVGVVVASSSSHSSNLTPMDSTGVHEIAQDSVQAVLAHTREIRVISRSLKASSGYILRLSSANC